MADQQIPVYKKDPAMVLIFGILTCGIYLIFWNINAAKVLNAVAGKELISTPVAVISGCCMPVHVYYYYLAGQAMGDIGRRIGKGDSLKDKSTLLVILGFFIPMVAAMIVQGHINELYTTNA